MSSASRLAVYELGRQVHAFIKANPLVSRSDLNAQFRANSDIHKADLLTEALLCLMTLKQVHKHMERGGTTVLFWTSDYRPSGFVGDVLVSRHPNPVDCLGSPPAAETPAPPPVPIVPGAVIRTSAPPPAPKVEEEEEDDEEEEAELPPVNANVQWMLPEEERQRVVAGLGGMLAKAYAIIAAQPMRLFRTNDECFMELHADPLVRAQNIGRLASMGVVKKAIDPATKAKTGYFTIEGAYPPALTQIAWVKKERVVAPPPTPAPSPAPAPAVIEDEQEQEEEELPEEGGLDVGDDQTEDEPEQEAYSPIATFTSAQTFQFVRGNGEVLDFDEEESAAWRALIRSLNIDRLKE